MIVILTIGAVVLVVSLLRLVMVTPPERMAAFLRKAGPIALIVAGGGLTLAGRGALGLPLAGFGIAAYRRLSRHAAPTRAEPDGGASGAGASTVRSRFLEMTLDHDSGDLEGLVLAGRQEGRRLADLTMPELIALRDEAAGDAESLRLLEAYLDRRAASWRDDAQTRAGDGLGGAPGAGAMTEEEAHQILGLQPGATFAEIREAHRRLMKRVHPDSGGSDFLAARINEAKAFLFERHR